MRTFSIFSIIRFEELIFFEDDSTHFFYFLKKFGSKKEVQGSTTGPKKIICWKVIGSLPLNEKYVIAVVPHSSYFDLVIAVLIRTYSGLKIKFIGSERLFISTLGL